MPLSTTAADVTDPVNQECPGCYKAARDCTCPEGPNLRAPAGKYWDYVGEVEIAEDKWDDSNAYWCLKDGPRCTCGRVAFTLYSKDAGDGWACTECNGRLHQKYSQEAGEVVTVGSDCTCPPFIQPGETWKRVDLAGILDGNLTDPEPVMLTRDDGHKLLYAGKVHTISGESESLKTWFALLACAEAIAAGAPVVYIDYEDTAPGIVGRLLALGCPKPDIAKWFAYIRPDEPLSPAAAAVLALCLDPVPRLAVIDGVTEAMAAHGLDPNSNSEVAAFNAKLPKPIAAAGAAVVMIDHVTKSREGRGRYAIGAQHKLSAVDGSAYTVDLLKPFGHGLHGMAKVIVAKDRPGRVREHCPDGVAGILHLRSQLDGSVLASIAPGRDFSGEAPAEFRPTVLMERISKACEQTPGLSKNALVVAAKGKTDHKKLALELLVAEGYIIEKRDRNSVRHESVKPFRDSLKDTLTPDPDVDPD